MIFQLKNGNSILIRSVENGDQENLLNYFNSLSAESRSRFGPHPFDRETIDQICKNVTDATGRFVAIDPGSEKILAYMIIKPGMIEWDEKRYASRNQFYDASSTVTFAPSVADAWQSSSVGSVMNIYIEELLEKMGIKTIILWGGVQATNEKAVNFYKKFNYQFIASFWHDDKDNFDMVKYLN